MSEQLYKIKLENGRILGPLNLNRIQAFIQQKVITGSEKVRKYPDHEWKEWHSFSELVELLPAKKHTLSLMTATPSSVGNEPKAMDEEAEKTILITHGNDSTLPDIPIQDHQDYEKLELIKQEVAEQPTLILKKPVLGEVEKKQGGPLGFIPQQHRRKVFVAIGLAVALIILLFGEAPKEQKKTKKNFLILLPSIETTADPQKAEEYFQKGLQAYALDDAENYQKAAGYFLKSASLDTKHVRSLALLASCYLNLVDHVKANESYFNVVTKIIEMARAKKLDLIETMIVDVELYLTLGNTEAAFQRINDYSKTHAHWEMELYYYLALTFFKKGQYAEALAQWKRIDLNKFYNPRVPYLYGRIFLKAANYGEAINAFEATLKQNPKHVHARALLVEALYKNNQARKIKPHVEKILAQDSLALNPELAKARYFWFKLLQIEGKRAEASEQIAKAIQLASGDSEVLYEYYLFKSQKEEDEQSNKKLKMFFHLARGERLLQENKLDEAITEFMNARNESDKDATPLLRLAEAFKRKEDDQAARTNYEKALQAAVKKEEVYPLFIRSLIQTYEFEAATKAIMDYKEKKPPVEKIDKLFGLLYLRQSKWKEASIYLKRALDESAADPELYSNYAQLLFEQAQFAQAAFYYGLALRIDPFSLDAILGIGKSLAEMQSLEQGTLFVQSFLKNDPNPAALLNGIAEMHLRKGDYENSLKFANHALEVNPKYFKAHKTKARAFAAQDRRKEALDQLMTYSNLVPYDPEGYIEKYKLFLSKNEKGEIDLKSARDAIMKVVKFFPHYPGAYYMLGDLYKTGKNYKSALEAALYEIKLNPGFLPAYVLAATVYNMNGEFEQALQMSNIAMQLSGNSVPVLLQAGIANHGAKSYAAAQSMLERARNLDQGNPLIYKRLGMLYYDLNKYNEMKESFQKYVELYPDAPDRSEVEDYLKKIP